MPNLLKFLSFSLFLLICVSWSSAQPKVLRQLKGLPSTEVYDVLTDSKGFLWIAHNAGISKYDGISFTNFSNPQQSSLATTNLLEDKHGRIWFINFTGQIFFIENGHMNLLSAYKSNAESYFPRIGLLNDLLIATSEKGLFICNTNTLKCHYERCFDCGNKPRIVSVILSILKNKVLAFGGRTSYVYEPGKGLRTAVFNDKEMSAIEAGGAALCTRSFNDTAFIFTNPANVVYKLTVDNDTIKIRGKKRFDSFINTISLVGDGYWINTINSSISGTKNNDIIKGYDISSMTVDKEGHHWYGSLQHGLLTDSLTTDVPQNDRVFSPNKGDVIKCMEREGETLLLGTQNGIVISYNTETNESTVLAALPKNNGGITYLKLLKGGKILIGMPLLTYIFDTRSRSLKTLDPIRSIKQAQQAAGAILAATSSNMIILPDKNDDVTFNALKKKFKGLDDFNYNLFGTNFRFLQYHIRSRAICYAQGEETIWVSCKTGLYKVNQLGVNPFYYHDSPVYTSCLTANKNQVIAGTFSDGIFIISGDSVRRLTANDGLLSNSIVNIKVVNRNLWVYMAGSVQVFDLQSLRLIYKYSFPDAYNIPVTDAEELNNKCYFISSSGLYKVSPARKEADSVNLYLNALFVNRKDTGVVNNMVLPHLSNDIQVSLGTPYLLNARDIVIKYRLKSTDSTKWFYSHPGERNFHFASLSPGNYQFEAFAIKPQTGLSSSPFIMNFTIRPPWWQTWWFRSVFIIVCVVVMAAALRIYYVNKLNQQKSQFEKKLIVEKERQHISREIHDHIGQALSVIKLNLNMGSASEIAEAREMISEVIQDMRQFTHGLYYGKLLPGSLVDVIKKDVERLNVNAKLNASLDIKVTKNMTDEHSELLIYRIFQEAINNILKHAYAKNISIRINSSRDQFKLIITDDGRGLSEEETEKGMGINSMHKRAELLKGTLYITSKPKEGCEVELVINHA